MPEHDDKTHLMSLQKLRLVDTIRFLQMFETGYGDYTQERHQWLDGQRVDEIAKQIRQKQTMKQS
ncbi:MAG: hypothetical protein IPL78_27335 [Chloroflexi bacterium]|nr:hypothetical protein [Chloroflexota bacterium]